MSNSSSWSDLPDDILLEVIKLLSLKDLVWASAVCKSWEPIVFDEAKRRSADMLLLLAHDRMRSTFHIDEIINAVQPAVFEPCSTIKRRFSVQSKEVRRLHSADVCASKYGWLLLSDMDILLNIVVIFFYNPLVNKIIELPPIQLPPIPSTTTREFASVITSETFNKSVYVTAATFKSLPTSPDCEIFVVVRDSISRICTIYTFDLQDKRWSTIRTPAAFCSYETIWDVAYIDGTLYCRVEKVFWSQLGRLYFNTNPYHGNCRDIWKHSTALDRGKVLSSYKLITVNVAFQIWGVMKCPIEEGIALFYYLVESTDGELFLAIMYQSYWDKAWDKETIGIDMDFIGMEYYWHVYQLDRTEKNWSRIHSLGNQVMLLNEKECNCPQSSSVVAPAVGDAASFADMIFVVGRNGSERCWSWESREGRRWSDQRRYHLDDLKGCSYYWI